MKRIIIALFLLILIISSVSFLKLRSYVIASTLQAGYKVQEPWLDKLQAYYFKVFKRANVYELLRRAYYAFGVPKKGIIHIGARHAEEIEYYHDLGISRILWIEADPAAEARLKQAVAKYPGSTVALFAAADSNGTIDLNVTNNDGHSSSILQPQLEKYYPNITKCAVVKVPKYKLDHYLDKAERQKYNIIVMDIQGAELIALKGATEVLKNIDAIITEINLAPMYEGSALVKDLDLFLAKHGFTRVDTISGGYYTGDAMYIKDKFFK